MRKTLLLFMLLSVKLTFGQVSDAFSDGNFSSNPSWSGNTSRFFVNASKQLQTVLSSDNQVVNLSVPNVLALNSQWEFSVQLNFDPSATNQAKIYLMSDISDLNGALNGYFIQIGENGSTDSYDLYKQVGTVVTKIIDGAAKVRTDVNKLTARIRVTRSETGKWELYTAIDGGNNYLLEGTIIDLTHAYSDWFGVNCKYTATRSDGFIFDDFSITEISPDVTPPSLSSAKAIDKFTVEATFSERLELSSALLASNYNINTLASPATILATSAPNVYRLTYKDALPSGDYKLTVSGVKDLNGNGIGTANSASFFYLKPYQLKIGDVMISEILVNPKTGGVDFIEIYNATNQMLDLKETQLANIDASGNLASIKNVSTISVYMPAKTYWVLTSNATSVRQNYGAKFPSQFIQMSMPAYNNDKGSVILLGAMGVLERLDYNENMHHALLRNVDGVALERVSFLKPANEIGNFRSAAMTSGFATPTDRNSQEENPLTINNSILLSSKTFSPDGDGFEDQLKIDYKFVTGGNLATVNIYTDKGELVRKLQRNITVATEGSFTWDGLNDHGLQSKIGIYIVKFDFFAVNGKLQSFKEACVLAARIN